MLLQPAFYTLAIIGGHPPMSINVFLAHHFFQCNILLYSDI